MASGGYLEGLLGSLPADLKRVFLPFVREAFSTLRFGAPPSNDGRAATENFGGGLVVFTTSGTTNAENAVPHGLGRTPRLIVPMLPAGLVDAVCPTLTIARAADDRNVYVSAAETDTQILMYVE